jgi:hypothetical protein
VKKGTLEKFGVETIADALEGSDVPSARVALSFAVGAAVDVSGTVLKRVKRDGQCKLVIQPGASVPGFVVFADCPGELENLVKLRIRKGSLVRVKGKFQTFGASAVCLSDCRLQQVATLKKRNKNATNPTPKKSGNCGENLKKPQI